MPFDYAVHSDLLVYWTGRRNIDQVYDPEWAMRNSSSTDHDLVKKEVKELLERRPRGPYRGHGGAESRGGRPRAQKENGK